MKTQYAKNRHFGTIVNFVGLLNIDTSSTCSHNMVNFGLLTAEICWTVLGTPANFNGFRGILVVSVSQTAALNRGRHLYSAGRPSRWASAHILVLHNLFVNIESNIYHFSFFVMYQSSTFHVIVYILFAERLFCVFYSPFWYISISVRQP